MAGMWLVELRGVNGSAVRKGVSAGVGTAAGSGTLVAGAAHSSSAAAAIRGAMVLLAAGWTNGAVSRKPPNARRRFVH